MDIHSGGFDLKFPHHDNELAQEHWEITAAYIRQYIFIRTIAIKTCRDVHRI